MRSMRNKKTIILAIIGMMVIGASIGYKIKSNANIKKNSLIVSSSKSKTVHKTKTKAELDSERPDKSIIKASDKGEDVIRIQTRLKKYGYNVVLDGDYGEGVIYAVMDFQQRHNLIPSGKVTAETIDVMYKTPTKDNMYKPATQSLLSVNDVDVKSTYESKLNSGENTSSTNNYILVDLSQQRVYVFYGSMHNWKLINTFSCGSGKAETPTVTGYFRVGIKGLNFKSGTDAAPVYCKYFTQISGNYLFHSILYDKSGNVIDGNLGAVESHGCIRLALENAKYIYDNIPIGSTIHVK
ncbi:L,D-transpeptidase family protein [Clostridium estertheticum]|uniref:L,D-transpeptidase family protein n=1 Tax=Clostridium estertheticum TaxID=238834 RepID=UPI001CF1CEA4|nr:L,D-transpeptidase family protein [Clostridium estertheticum]MCB2358275.1 L,D-transpeptidase family protein [Clostridium estertheticum]